MERNHFDQKKEKILLMTLPFLTPLIPPVGISCLKSYLQEKGYRVKTADAMADIKLRELCYLYFDTLKSYIPVKKQGHFFNVGLDVLFNHFMAHINYRDENQYIDLVKQLVYQSFFVDIHYHQVREMNRLAAVFFEKLEQYLLQLIQKENPTLVGLSVYKGTLAASLFAARIIKKNRQDIKILMGGTIFSQDLFPGTPNFYRFMEQALQLDKVFIGESELLLLKYLQGALPENKKVYTLDDIDKQMVDMNTLSIPDYSDFDLSGYPLIGFYTSRGCTFRCSFCAETVYWKKYHHQEPSKVVDGFEELNRIYEKKLFVLADCLVNPLVTPLAEEMIRRELGFYWDVYIKVDKYVCNPQYTQLWRRGGYYRARLGIESGSQAVLNLIDKRITVEAIKLAIKALAAAGIKTTTYWIAGHPGETEADFQETLDLLEELQDDLFEAECDPFRYFHTGQVNANLWADKRCLLYPEDMTDMLLTQTWTLDATPNRAEIYDRQCRFKEQCKKLGIPNPYSVSELYHADNRWKQLHKNAVPTVLELSDQRTPVNDHHKHVHTLLSARPGNREDVGFSF